MIVLTSIQITAHPYHYRQVAELPLNEPSPPDKPSQSTSERGAPREDNDRAVLTSISRNISSVQRLALIHQRLTQRARDDRSYASSHRKQTKDDIGVGILVLSLQFADDAAPAC
jgi:hypothetical protein